MSDVETNERTLTRKERREAKRNEKQNLLANLVRCRNAWAGYKAKDFKTYEIETAFARSQVRWLNKQIALFEQRESKQHGPIQE